MGEAEEGGMERRGLRRVAPEDALPRVYGDPTCGICLDDAQFPVQVECCRKVLCKVHMPQLKSCPYCRAIPLRAKVATLCSTVHQKHAMRIKVAVRVRPLEQGMQPTGVRLSAKRFCRNCLRGKKGVDIGGPLQQGSAVMCYKNVKTYRDAIDQQLDPSGELIRAPAPGPYLPHLGTIQSVRGENAVVKLHWAVGHGEVSEEVEKPLSDLRHRCVNSGSGSDYSHDLATVVNTAPVRGPAGGSKGEYECNVFFDSSATQEDVYQHFAQDVAAQVKRGHSCCLFAYGMTGSGKTHTMSGSWEDPGLIPRLAESLFTNVSPQTLVTMEYFEIYCEGVRDLLVQGAPRRTVPVKRTPIGHTYFEGISRYEIKGLSDLLVLLDEGNARRSQASTALNATSSRSHTLLCITILDKDGGQCSKLHLVDLAGSEPLGRIHSSEAGGRWGEGRSINLSLLTLGRVIHTLAQPQSKSQGDGGVFVPLRESVLTEFLSDSLGGTSRTFIVATVRPDAPSSGETRETLRFAHNAGHVAIKARGPVVTIGEEEGMLRKQLRRIFAHEWVIGRSRASGAFQRSSSMRRSHMSNLTGRFNPVTWRAVREGVPDSILPEDQEEIDVSIQNRPLPRSDMDIYMELQMAELRIIRRRIEARASSQPELLAQIRNRYPHVFALPPDDDPPPMPSRGRPRVSMNAPRARRASQPFAVVSRSH
eukprot:Hpha_TRINITY_DN11685_c0_g1::TRINITY_DN11685_c0_g1_i1::g.49244::m.49244/K17914/KIF13; kinesin family member 13